MMINIEVITSDTKLDLDLSLIARTDKSFLSSSNPGLIVGRNCLSWLTIDFHGLCNYGYETKASFI